MAQASHVPSFANLASEEDVSYTDIFQKARKDRMDPGEPQGNSDKSVPPVQPPPLEMKPEHRTSQEGRVNPKSAPGSPSRCNIVGRNHTAAAELEAPKHEHGSTQGDGASGMRSPPKERKPSSEAGIHIPWRSRPTSVTHEDELDEGVTVPKFSELGGHNPASGDEYSLIFSKEKAERQREAGRILAVPPESSRTSAQKQHANGNPKICCCCCPWGRK